MLTQVAKELGIHSSQIGKGILNTSDKGENVTANIDLADLKFNELRKVAAERGIIVPFGTRKAELIKLLKGEK